MRRVLDAFPVPDLAAQTLLGQVRDRGVDDERRRCYDGRQTRSFGTMAAPSTGGIPFGAEGPHPTAPGEASVTRPAVRRMVTTALSAGVVLATASVSRLRNYDLGWFGWDQAYFLAEARRVVDGDFTVTGPLAVGVNVIGPLYSYLLGGLLWIGGDARFLALANAWLELGAVGLVFLAALRFSGRAGAIAAAVTYASVPILVLSTRLIWNPSWLPALSVLGWWLVFRYSESRSRSAIAALGFVAGLAPGLHATGGLHSLGWVLAVLLCRPSLGRLSLAALSGLLPLLPLLSRLATGAIQASGAQPLVAFRGLNDIASTLDGIDALVAAFPLALADGVWPGAWSTWLFRVTAVLAVAGIIRGVLRPNPYRPAWVGIASTFLLHIAAAALYSGNLSWYYFMALVGPLSLGLAQILPALGGRTTQRAVAAGLGCAAVVHLAFVWEFDRRTLETGYLTVDGRGLAVVNEHSVWRQHNAATGHSMPIRMLRSVAEALGTFVPGGTTAMQVAHGAGAELWRTTGAEFMAADNRPPTPWPWHFMIMGRGASAVERGAFVRGNLCVFERRDEPQWALLEGRAPPTWDSPGFDDGAWPRITLPQRTVGTALAGPNIAHVVRTSNVVRLRSWLDVEGSVASGLIAVAIHGHLEPTVILGVNGSAVHARRRRVMASDVSRTDEWLFDVAPHLRAGANLVTVQVFAPSSVFDVDVFRVPCVDTEWYF